LTNFTNVFVLCTGRCGSVTLSKACRHIKNWTAGHETRVHVLGPDRLNYGARHIEVDNRLAWFLGRLDAVYGERAGYIWLQRDLDATARSYARRRGTGLMKAYEDCIHFGDPAARTRNAFEIAFDLVWTVSFNIEHFLRSVPDERKRFLQLERAGEDFPRIWEWLEAEGDFQKALAEWKTTYNASLR